MWWFLAGCVVGSFITIFIIAIHSNDGKDD